MKSQKYDLPEIHLSNTEVITKPDDQGD